jgi:hypothetical protein
LGQDDAGQSRPTIRRPDVEHFNLIKQNKILKILRLGCFSFSINLTVRLAMRHSYTVMVALLPFDKLEVALPGQEKNRMACQSSRKFAGKPLEGPNRSPVRLA